MTLVLEDPVLTTCAFQSCATYVHPGKTLLHTKKEKEMYFKSPNGSNGEALFWYRLSISDPKMRHPKCSKIHLFYLL